MVHPITFCEVEKYRYSAIGRSVWVIFSEPVAVLVEALPGPEVTALVGGHPYCRFPQGQRLYLFTSRYRRCCNVFVNLVVMSESSFQFSAKLCGSVSTIPYSRYPTIVAR
jgi:hypothetical protein